MEKEHCYRCGVLQDFQGYCQSCKIDKREEELAESEDIKDSIYD